MGKFFCSVLNIRLHKCVKENKILYPSQIGFLPGNRTADHVFTLQTLYDKYVMNTNRGKLYACFVDFLKAFDSIWHQGLFHKLTNYGICGNFNYLIESLYSQSECAIKIGNKMTTYFRYQRGVRQRCILSPLLFNIYLNELPTLLTSPKSDPLILPDGTQLNCLLYADDLVILSKSKHGLQNCLNSLSLFCEKWMMEINLKKIKILIFQKVCRKNNNSQFYLNNKYIDIAQQYTFLGLSLTANGNFTSAQEKLKEKALYALFAIMKYTEIKRLPLKLESKVFDTLILPILTYNNEVWSAYLKHDLNKLDQFNFEKVQLKFCKYYLGVNRKAVNYACRAELGHLPLKLVIEKRILSYLLHLQSLDIENLATKAYKLSVH